MLTARVRPLPPQQLPIWMSAVIARPESRRPGLTPPRIGRLWIGRDPVEQFRRRQRAAVSHMRPLLIHISPLLMLRARPALAAPVSDRNAGASARPTINLERQATCPSLPNRGALEAIAAQTEPVQFPRSRHRAATRANPPPPYEPVAARRRTEASRPPRLSPTARLWKQAISRPRPSPVAHMPRRRAQRLPGISAAIRRALPDQC